MQIVSCEVLLGGDLTNTVIKHDVSIPEIAVLSHIHGVGSVQNIKVQGKDKRPAVGEKSRLAVIYGAKLVDQLFPGTVPNFPKTLREIGISDSEEDASPFEQEKDKGKDSE